MAILLLSCSQIAAAQFAPVNAEWTYNDHNGNTHQNFPRGIVSIADTLIQGHNCHIVIGDCACGGSQTNFVYEINRRVYWFNYALGDFTLLYDFNLNAGGVWTVVAQNTTSDSLELRVDSTGTEIINGFLCKVQYIHTVATYGNAYVFEGPVTEWIGSRFCLYPQSAACDPPTFGLRCYYDDSLGNYDTQLAPSCENVFIDSGNGIPEIASRISVSLSPNPFHNEAELSIKNYSGNEAIFEIEDATGRKMRSQKIISDRIKIEKDNLDAGIYYYSVRMKENAVQGKLIII